MSRTSGSPAPKIFGAVVGDERDRDVGHGGHAIRGLALRPAERLAFCLTLRDFTRLPLRESFSWPVWEWGFRLARASSESPGARATQLQGRTEVPNGRLEKGTR